jgi:hypothetical protein
MSGLHSFPDGPPSSRRNPDAHHLDRLPTRRHHLALCFCEPAPHEAGQHAAAEALDVDE